MTQNGPHQHFYSLKRLATSESLLTFVYFRGTSNVSNLSHVGLVLQCLTDVGFALNLRKSLFAVTDVDDLEYWITWCGIQPQPKKVEAIMHLAPPTTNSS